jgi:hypothetical protein
MPKKIKQVTVMLTPKVNKVKVTPKPRKRRNKTNLLNNNRNEDTVFMKHPAVPESVATSSKRAYNNVLSSRLTGLALSKEDVSFLKCAFAAPDFSGIDVAGIPDQYNGMSLVKKHKNVVAASYAPAFDIYYILAPVPGIAYFTTSVPAGTSILATTTFLATGYSDFQTLFGLSSMSNANVVTKFRFVSNHFELIPTVNQMTWTGNIQAFTVPLELCPSVVPATSTLAWDIHGLQGLNGANSTQYTAPFNLGCFGAAYNRNSTFDFQPVLENVDIIPPSGVPGSFGSLLANGGIPGFDNNMDSLVIKISGVTAAESAIIKTWACVEYQVLPGTSIYEYMTMSPCYSEQTLRLYREIVSSLPVAVTFLDNANFWMRVLDIIKRISGSLSVVPGPYGLIAGGVNAVSTGIESLVI